MRIPTATPKDETRLDQIVTTLIERMGDVTELDYTIIRWMTYKRGPLLMALTYQAAKKLHEADPVTHNFVSHFYFAYPKVKKQYKAEGHKVLAWPFGRPANLQKPIY